MSKNTVSALFILVALGVIYFLFLPQWQAVNEAKADHDAANFAIDEFKKLSDKRDLLRDTYNKVNAPLLDKATQVISSGPQVAGFLADLEALALKNGLILHSVDFGSQGAPAPNAGAKPASSSGGAGLNLSQGVFALPFTVQVVGKYDSFKSFLSDLELNQRLIDVTGINFGAPRGDIFEFSIQAKSYYQ